jgi:hypothetical protein
MTTDSWLKLHCRKKQASGAVKLFVRLGTHPSCFLCDCKLKKELLKSIFWRMVQLYDFKVKMFLLPRPHWQFCAH